MLLPLTVLTALLRRFVSLVSGGRVLLPSVISFFDGRVFKPYELRRVRHEHMADATHGIWKRVGDRVAERPVRVIVGSVAVLLVMCAGLAFFSTDLTTNDSYRTEVESVEGQELLAQSFPAGASAPADVIVPPDGDVDAVVSALEEADGIESVSPPVAEGEPGVLVQATLEPQPYSTEAFDLIEPIRDAAQAARCEGTIVGGASAVEFDVREAAAWDSTVIPPIVLVVVFLILVLLLRAVIAPLILIGTVIVELPGRARRGLLRVRRLLRLPGLGSVAAAVRVRVPGGAGRGLQHLPDGAGARGDVKHGTARACCALWRSPAG